MTTETPRERFERVIRPRVEKAMKAIELIGNGASREYDPPPEEIAELLASLRLQLEEVEARYHKRFYGHYPPGDFHDTHPAEAEGSQSPRSAPLDNGDAPRQLGEPAPASTAEFLGLNRHRLPMFVVHLPGDLVAPLVTHLVNRLAEMADEKGRAA